MRLFSEYDLIIFDCDGVILDSNQLKIDAMEHALTSNGFSGQEVKECADYFAANFGKSRFFHIDYFITHILDMKKRNTNDTKKLLLKSFSRQCKRLYLEAHETAGLNALLNSSKATMCVASGSEQNELQQVFEQRKLSQYFSMVLGSPVKKVDLVSRIVNECHHIRAVMIGDAISDLEAASLNGIDFVFYSPLSNVKNEMRELCRNYSFRIIDSFEELIGEL